MAKISIKSEKRTPLWKILLHKKVTETILPNNIVNETFEKWLMFRQLLSMT